MRIFRWSCSCTTSAATWSLAVAWMASPVRCTWPQCSGMQRWPSWLHTIRCSAPWHTMLAATRTPIDMRGRTWVFSSRAVAILATICDSALLPGLMSIDRRPVPMWRCIDHVADRKLLVFSIGYRYILIGECFTFAIHSVIDNTIQSRYIDIFPLIESLNITIHTLL